MLARLYVHKSCARGQCSGASGYSNMSALKKDEKGNWRGTAMKNGKSVQVSLDLQGNIAVN